MKNFQKILAIATVLVSVFALAGTAFAATPILSVTQSGSSYTLTINNADPNASITLSERQSSSLFSNISGFGTTDGNGNFTITQSLPFDGSSNPLIVYVTVDGLASSQVDVYSSGACVSNCTTQQNLSLSQTSLSLNSGQSYVITAYPTNGGSVYVSSNSNPSVFSSSVSGDQVTVSGLATGGGNLILCANSGSQCSTMTVSVNGGSASGVSFSSSNPTIVLGQTQVVNIFSSSGNTNGFYVSSNSNSSVVSATLSGSSLSLYGQSVGTDAISVCQSGTSFCSSLNVTVGSSNSGGSFSITPNTLSLSPGQTGTATVSNAYSTFYVSSNSNSSVVSAGISGQTVTIYAIANGTSSLSICENGYTGCVSLYVVVSGTANSISGSLSFSTANPVLTIGQSQTDTIYPPNGTASSYYISSNSNSSAVSATLNGSSLTLFGQSAGTDTINVCSNGYSYCGNVYVTVNGYSGGVSFSQSTVNLNLGQNSSVVLSGGTGSYVLTSNTSPSSVSASLSGTTLYLDALNNGTATITVCQNGNTTACGQVVATVGGGTNSGLITFSNSSPDVSIGQTLSVNIYTTNGWTGSYMINGNTNPAAASVNVSGTSLSITGLANGNTTLSVCQTNTSICGSLNVIVGTGGGGSPVVSTGSLPAITVNQPYSSQLVSSGGSGNYVYNISSGSLPPGLSLSSTGLISGTPTITGSYTFTIMVSSNGTEASQNFTLTVNPLNTTPTPTPSAGAYPNGELINENGTISIVYQNLKTGFANAGAFTGLGFSFSNVVSVSNSGLATSGQIVNTASAAHPWGSWVLSGTTVYFVSQSGLIPVPNWATFLSNGGQAGFIVPANSYDLALTQLSLMVPNDSRLQ